MIALLKAWWIAFLPLIWHQGIAYSPVQAQFAEAMSTASTDGLPVLARKLDSIVSANPNSPLNPSILETIQVIELLHPGSVPDASERLESMIRESDSDPVLGLVVSRLEILHRYYQAAVKENGESVVKTLEDPVFEGSLLAMHALADASLRRGDYQRAEQWGKQLIEADPYSPLIADIYVILGICSTYRGDPAEAARYFQKALLLTELPTIYGRTQDYLAATYRFIRPIPGKVGRIFDEVVVTPIPAIQIRDPQTLVASGEQFILVDREQIVSISQDGGIVDRKPARKLRDSARSGAQLLWSLADESLDPGTDRPMRLTLTARGKTKQLKKMRSLDLDDRGDLYLLDEDSGLLRGRTDENGNIVITALTPVKGRLVRIDRRGFLYILAWDRRSISVYSRDGKPITTIIPAAGGRKPSIAAFALDRLNHIYILEEESKTIQVFAVNGSGGNLRLVQIDTIPLETRQQFEDLKVMAVSDTGELALTGKNRNNWIVFK